MPNCKLGIRIVDLSMGMSERKETMNCKRGINMADGNGRKEGNDFYPLWANPQLL